MRKFLLPLLLLCLITIVAPAQDFPFGEVNNNELSMQKYDKDTSAHAVVLNEYGSSHMGFDNDYRVVITFMRHVKIKFFDNKDFESEGTIEIPIYSGDDDRYEDIFDIKGITFYKDENGVTQKTELDQSKVYRTKDSKHWTTVKFAMPALRNGCVIDVTYKISSPYKFNFRGWDFQDHIPKMNSEYEVHIPGFWDYNASLIGPLKLTTNKATLEPKCMTYGTAAADCSDILYGMTDIPAFIPEDYMTSEKNFMSAISYQLVQETAIQGGARYKYTKDWKDVDYLLKTDNTFGGQLKRTSLLKERIAPVIAGKTSDLEKAKAVYNFIKSTIKWNDHNNFVSENGVKQALDNHTGNSGDINLALITALNAAGITTEAMVLSTRENGFINKLYPDVNNFNYVIGKATIGDQTYLLDATEPLMPFGMLPFRCFNDQGRVFSLNKPSYWYDIATQQSEKTTYTFDLTMQEDGKITGTISRFSMGYSAYLKRQAIKKFNSVDEYLEHISEESGNGIKILKSNIANVDSLEMPLAETFNVQINTTDKMTNGRFGLNPFILDRLKVNPFKLAQRNYPVDRGMPTEERYIVNIHLPEQYTLETQPQPIAFGLPNQGGKFLTDFQSDNNTLTFSYITQVRKSVYSPEEYPYLKELYNKIILAEKNVLVFKKKS